MLWKGRDASERISINFEQFRIRNMLWKKRDVTERIFINFEQELNKKQALEDEGCFKDDFNLF